MAFVLFIAASLKIYYATGVVPSALTNPIPASLLRLLPWFEILLAGWLVSGLFWFGSWLTATVIFLFFSLHSLLLVIGNQASCGCLGNVTLAPKYTLAMDVALIALLGVARSRWCGWPTTTPFGRLVLQTAVLGFILLTSVSIWASTQYGSVDAALSVARGEPAVVSPSNLNLGVVPAGGTVRGVLQVYNNTNETMQIALADSGCSCAVIQDLPIDIPPSHSMDVAILVTVSNEPGRFQRIGRFQSSAGTLSYTITAVVVSTPSPEDGP